MGVWKGSPTPWTRLNWYKASWHCCEPTCFCLGSLFDLDQCDLWPWPMWPSTLISVTFNLSVTFEMHDAKSLKPCFVYMVTLTFDLEPHDLCPWNLWPLTSRPHVIYTVKSPWKSGFSTWWPWPLTFTHDLYTINVDHHTKFEQPIKVKQFQRYKFLYCEFLSNELFSSHRQTDRLTDRQTDTQKAMHKIPPCMSTGG